MCQVTHCWPTLSQGIRHPCCREGRPSWQQAPAADSQLLTSPVIKSCGACVCGARRRRGQPCGPQGRWQQVGALQHRLLTLQPDGNLLLEMVQAAGSSQLTTPGRALLLLAAAFPRLGAAHAAVCRAVAKVSPACSAGQGEALEVLLEGIGLFFLSTALMKSCLPHPRARWYEACLLSAQRHPQPSRSLGQE